MTSCLPVMDASVCSGPETRFDMIECALIFSIPAPRTTPMASRAAQTTTTAPFVAVRSTCRAWPITNAQLAAPPHPDCNHLSMAHRRCCQLARLVRPVNSLLRRIPRVACTVARNRPPDSSTRSPTHLCLPAPLALWMTLDLVLYVLILLQWIQPLILR